MIALNLIAKHDDMKLIVHLYFWLDLSRLIGIAPFDYTVYGDGGGLEWEAWLRSFEWYLQANKVEDDHDKYVKLMHLAGQKIQELYATLPVPENVSKAPRGPLVSGFTPHLTEYEMAVAKLNDHFQPKKNTTYERYELRKLKQNDDEKIAAFAMRLRKQAERCDFGDNFEDHVKDQLIEKCSSSRLRRKLLALGDAKLDVVIREAKAFEAVQEQGQALDEKLDNHDKTIEVNKIDTHQKAVPSINGRAVVCHRCGYTGHRQFDDKCPAKGKTCNKCGGANHFSRRCRTKGEPNRKRNRRVIEKTEQSNDNAETRQMVKSEDEPPYKRKVDDTVKFIAAETENEYIFHIEQSGDRAKNEMECTIGGVKMTVVIDSGTKRNIIDVQAWEYLKANKVVVVRQGTSSNVHFSAYGDHPLTLVGVFEAEIRTTKHRMNAEFYVVKDYGRVLIGYETATSLKVLTIGENVNRIETEEKAGKIKGIIVNIPINPSVKPVAQPYRRIPVPLEKAVNDKIDELSALGIIEKVDGPSDWISPMVVVPKVNDVRICVDMRRANEAIDRENYPLPTIEDFIPHMNNANWFTKLDVKNAFHQVKI